MRRLLAGYPLILGGAASALLVNPIGIGGDFGIGAWILIGAVIAAVTFALDRYLRGPFTRWAPANAFVLIPITASAVGIIAGWLAANNLIVGGPTLF